MTPTLVLVDGSNIARCAAWRSSHDASLGDVELRRRLVDAIAGWATREGHVVEVAFDGAGPWRPGRVVMTGELAVTGSGSREGDDVLERLAAEAHRAGRAYWLVTSDRALGQVAGSRADRILDADAFIRLVQVQHAAPIERSADADAGAASASGLFGNVDDETRARLERMRRGEA